MEEVIFLKWDELLEIHRDQLRKYGGQDGFVDQGVVKSALARVQFTAQFDPDSDIADLAADYLFGLATTQGFCDGNKRAALMAAAMFQRKNGRKLIVSNKLMYIVALSVARNELDRDGLAEILRTHMASNPENDIEEDGD